MVIAKLQALCRHMGVPHVAKLSDLAISLSTCSFAVFLTVSLELWTSLSGLQPMAEATNSAAHASICKMLQQLPDTTEVLVLQGHLMLEGIRLLSLWDLTPLMSSDHPDHTIIKVSLYQPLEAHTVTGSPGQPGIILGFSLNCRQKA